MDQDCLKLVELLDLKEEEKIVLQKRPVTWVYMDAFFESYLSEVVVGNTLEDHA